MSLDSILTLRDALFLGEKIFKKAQIHLGHGSYDEWDEAVLLATHILHLSPTDNSHFLDRRLSEDERRKIVDLFSSRVERRIPAPYLIKQAQFAGRTFYVDERVLIPRSSIFEFIEKKFYPFIDSSKVERMLDIGTGSGALAIIAALSFPRAKVDALDISKDALRVAEINAKKYRVADRIELIESDLFSAIAKKKYDVIISNPPYVSEKKLTELPFEYLHEPRLALAGGKSGLDIVQKILFQAKDHLSPNGLLIVEVGGGAIALEKQFHRTPFLWLEFEHGEGEVFLLTREELDDL